MGKSGKTKSLQINKTTRNNLVTYGIVIAAYIIVEILINGGHLSSLMKGLLVPLCIYTIMAISLNLTVGILGELSLGHAGFMCVGAFSSSLFSICMLEAIPSVGVRFTLAILVGAAAAAVAGIIVGIPVLRLRGDYLAIVTLAFGEIIKNVVNVIYLGKDANGIHVSIKNAMALNMAEDGQIIMNGAQGINGTPKNATFTVGIILILITLFIVLNLIHSRSGRAIMSVRDNRIAAESIGINITKYKLMAFTISASLAGVAGVLYSHNLSALTATQKNFGYNQSIMILVFVVLGGIGNIRGSMIAAVILTLLPELLRGLNTYRMLIYAIVLIVMMIFNWSPKFIDFRKRHSLRRYFHKNTAVDDFSITIEKGQLYGLIGPNGAGKTTIFNLLTGVYKPNMGTIQLDGMNITGKKTMEINRAGVARTFQNIRLFKELTVLDNVKAGLHNQYSYSTVAGILRLPKYFKVEKTMDEKAVELLKVFDLDKEKDYLASNLPYGKQRKLEIARALATNPKLLLLDEPAAGMNPNETKELMDTIRFVRDNFDMTILLIEHDMKLVSGICEKLTVLNFGQVLAQGNTVDVLNDPEVIKAYLGE